MSIAATTRAEAQRWMADAVAQAADARTAKATAQRRPASRSRADVRRWMADANAQAAETRMARLTRKRRLLKRSRVIAQLLAARTREIATLERELAAVNQELKQL